MTSEEIKNEAQHTFDSLKEFTQRRREWYQEQHLRIADRQSQQVAIISSISAAILAITTVFSSNNIDIWANLSFLLLVINVVFGTFLILWLINFDSKILKEDRDLEIDILEKLKKSVQKVISNPTIAKRNENLTYANQIADKIESTPLSFQQEKRLMEYVYYIVLATFLGGVIALAIAWFNMKYQIVNRLSNNTYFSQPYHRFRMRPY